MGLENRLNQYKLMHDALGVTKEEINKIFEIMEDLLKYQKDRIEALEREIETLKKQLDEANKNNK